MTPGLDGGDAVQLPTTVTNGRSLWEERWEAHRREHDVHDVERWLSHRREHETHDESHRQQHEETANALAIARARMDERLEQMNEFRDQLNRERSTYVLRDVLDQYRDAMAKQADLQVERQDKQLDLVSGRVTVLERAQANQQGKVWAVGALLGAFVVVVNIAIAIVSNMG